MTVQWFLAGTRRLFCAIKVQNVFFLTILSFYVFILLSFNPGHLCFKSQEKVESTDRFLLDKISRFVNYVPALSLGSGACKHSPGTDIALIAALVS